MKMIRRNVKEIRSTDHPPLSLSLHSQSSRIQICSNIKYNYYNSKCLQLITDLEEVWRQKTLGHDSRLQRRYTFRRIFSPCSVVYSRLYFEMYIYRSVQRYGLCAYPSNIACIRRLDAVKSPDEFLLVLRYIFCSHKFTHTYRRQSMRARYESAPTVVEIFNRSGTDSSPSGFEWSRVKGLCHTISRNTPLL